MFVRACETLAMTPTAFDPAAMVLHCYVCARVCEALAMTPTAFDPGRGAGPDITPGQERNVLLFWNRARAWDFCRNCRNRVGTVVGTVVGTAVKTQAFCNFRV